MTKFPHLMTKQRCCIIDSFHILWLSLNGKWMFFIKIKGWNCLQSSNYIIQQILASKSTDESYHNSRTVLGLIFSQGIVPKLRRFEKFLDIGYSYDILFERLRYFNESVLFTSKIFLRNLDTTPEIIISRSKELFLSFYGIAYSM